MCWFVHWFSDAVVEEKLRLPTNQTSKQIMWVKIAVFSVDLLTFSQSTSSFDDARRGWNTTGNVEERTISGNEQCSNRQLRTTQRSERSAESNRVTSCILRRCLTCSSLPELDAQACCTTRTGITVDYTYGWKRFVEWFKIGWFVRSRPPGKSVAWSVTRPAGRSAGRWVSQSIGARMPKI